MSLPAALQAAIRDAIARERAAHEEREQAEFAAERTGRAVGDLNHTELCHELAQCRARLRAMRRQRDWWRNRALQWAADAKAARGARKRGGEG